MSGTVGLEHDSDKSVIGMFKTISILMVLTYYYARGCKYIMAN